MRCVGERVRWSHVVAMDNPVCVPDPARALFGPVGVGYFYAPCIKHNGGISINLRSEDPIEHSRGRDSILRTRWSSIRVNQSASAVPFAAGFATMRKG